MLLIYMLLLNHSSFREHAFACVCIRDLIIKSLRDHVGRIVMGSVPDL